MRFSAMVSPMNDLRLTIHTALQELFDERNNGAAGKGLSALLLFRQWVQTNGKEAEGGALPFISTFLPTLAATSKTAAEVLRLRFIELAPELAANMGSDAALADDEGEEVAE